MATEGKGGWRWPEWESSVLIIGGGLSVVWNLIRGPGFELHLVLGAVLLLVGLVLWWQPGWKRGCLVVALLALAAAPIQGIVVEGANTVRIVLVSFFLLCALGLIVYEPPSEPQPKLEEEEGEEGPPAERDRRVCDKAYKLIVAADGRVPDASQLPEEQRVVLLTYHALGRIGDGGFRSLFESNVSGDPHFALTTAAFETIGAKTAADILRQALALFPGSKPPTDVNHRLLLYRQGEAGRRHALDNAFSNAKDDIIRHLARYIRQHRDVFARLKKSMKE
jgi:Domain of unknown function (DUF4375)